MDDATRIYTARVDRLRVLSAGFVGFGLSPTLVSLLESVFGGLGTGLSSPFYLVLMAIGFVLPVVGYVALAMSHRYPMKTNATLVAMSAFVASILPNRS